MDRAPSKRETDKATRPMKEAVDKVIQDKKKEPIGTKQAEGKVAADLNEAAQEDTKRSNSP